MQLFLRYLRELPLAWFFAGCLFARIGLFLCPTSSPQHRAAWLRRVPFAAGLFVLFAYLAIVLYSLRCFMIQLDEANILSISAASLRGLPMYNPPASPDSSYSIMYGPTTFFIYRVFLIAGGVNHFWIMRGAIVIANFGLCAALYVLLRRFVSVPTAIALLVFPLSILLEHPQASLGIRSDIWIFLFSALAIVCSFLEVELAAVILTGVMCGVLVGLKISAAPAILFPLLMLYRRFGLRAPIISLLATITTALAPFAFTNISLHNYIAWILFTRSEGIATILLWKNIAFALFLISPCLFMELFMRRFGVAFRRRLPEFLLIVLCLLLAVSTSKPGSGPWYFWHIIPSIVVYLALISRDLADLPTMEQGVPVYYISVACTLLACAFIPRAYGNIKVSMAPGVGLAQQAIDRYLDLYRDHSSIQMGFGSVDTDYRTALRYVLVYKGQPYTLEGNTGRFETRLLPFPVHVLNRMANCKDDVWLLPHAQEPFALWVLPDTLRSTFLQNYSVDRSDGLYDAWVCNRAKAH
jgi:hypothetical protein